MHPHTPRIGIIGSGAIGGFYGLMLARAGFDVHFFAQRVRGCPQAGVDPGKCRAWQTADKGAGLFQCRRHAALRLAAGGCQGHQQ